MTRFEEELADATYHARALQKRVERGQLNRSNITNLMESYTDSGGFTITWRAEVLKGALAAIGLTPEGYELEP